MIKGQIIGGEFNNILLRQKSGSDLEIGEILVTQDSGKKLLMQVYDLQYGSQISKQNLELISGMNLEDNIDMDVMDETVRNYNIALLKNLVTVKNQTAWNSKSLPAFFSTARSVTENDVDFLSKPLNPLFIGNLRSGTKPLEFPIYLDSKKILSHHILIPATTGRGKSNLTSCILWDTLENTSCGLLVLDPHDEYYENLKDHPKNTNMVYYTVKNPPPGARTLTINLSLIRPHHLKGVIDFTDPQQQALHAYHRFHKERWIEAIILSKPLSQGYEFAEGTLAVLRRKLMSLFGLSIADNMVHTNSVFSLNSGKTTIKDILSDLENSKTVIIDTSQLPGNVEILVGSMVANDIFAKYKNYKIEGKLQNKPVISVILEEAPRVLGKDVLEKGSNIFETIAREGRKFCIGLTAITQLPSLIPKQILANMNTKIVLGIEMKTERSAVIESASQDLSTDDRNIASLDKGEAIITSNFTRFAIPVKVPLFENFKKKKTINTTTTKSYQGINLE